MTGFFDFQSVTPVQSVQYQKLDGTTVRFLIKRDDLIHPAVSGNKWRKLKYNLTLAQSGHFAGIASFGGAFSNHIAALSALGQATNTPTVGFIRTQEIDLNNPTLRLAKQHGMSLVPLSREDYRSRHDPLFLAQLKKQYSRYLFVPEGGSNHAAQQGLRELANEISEQCKFDRFAVAIGSGGTIEGLLDNLPHSGIGIAVVKDDSLLSSLQSRYPTKLTLRFEPTLGKYGATTPMLEQFCLDFFRQTQVPIEPIYTGKLFYNLCYNREILGIDDNERLLVVHTGGLQGIKGLIYRQKISASDWSSVI
jgi:1-aminocyclopropane-1-carboxylate deaminase